MVNKILKFYADWCGPCKVMTQNLKGANLTNVELVEVDADDDKNQELVSYHNIRNLPTTMFLDENDNILERVTGILPTSKINEIISKYAD